MAKINKLAYRCGRIYKGISLKWIAIAILFAVAALITISNRGFETGFYVTSGIVMLAVMFRTFIEFVYFLFCREPLTRKWRIQLIASLIYIGLMVFLDKEKIIVFLLVLSLLMAIGVVLVERILTFIKNAR